MKRMIDADALLEWVWQQKANGLREGRALGEDGLLIANTINALVLDTFIEVITKNTTTFDDDGWCWDMSKAPKDEEFDVLCLDTSRNKNYRFPDCYWDEEENKIVNEYYNYFNDHRYKMIAWRPLPNIPEVKS